MTISQSTAQNKNVISSRPMKWLKKVEQPHLGDYEPKHDLNNKHSILRWLTCCSTTLQALGYLLKYLKWAEDKCTGSASCPRTPLSKPHTPHAFNVSQMCTLLYHAHWFSGIASLIHLQSCQFVPHVVSWLLVRALCCFIWVYSVCIAHRLV